MASDFICIYCKLIKPDDQRSKEHLLQRSLGGDLTARFVRKGCNGGFSRIDQALSDRYAVTLLLVMDKPAVAQRVKSGGVTTYFDRERNIFVEVELRNRSEEHTSELQSR